LEEAAQPEYGSFLFHIKLFRFTLCTKLCISPVPAKGDRIASATFCMHDRSHVSKGDLHCSCSRILNSKSTWNSVIMQCPSSIYNAPRIAQPIVRLILRQN